MASGTFTLTAEFPKLTMRRLQRLLGHPDELYGGGVRGVLEETVGEMETRARARAPIGTTMALSRSIDSEIHNAPIPLWGKVTASASHGSFRYGWALQGSRKVAYHYAGTSKLTRRWFTGALAGQRRKLQQRLTRLASRLEQRWRR